MVGVHSHLARIWPLNLKSIESTAISVCILSPNTEKTRLEKMLRKRKGESLPKLSKTYEELIKADAKLAFYMRVVKLKGPITKPIEIQKNR